MANKETRINVRADERWIARLGKAAAVLDRSASQIVREAVNEKLDALAASNPALRAALERAA